MSAPSNATTKGTSARRSSQAWVSAQATLPNQRSQAPASRLRWAGESARASAMAAMRAPSGGEPASMANWAARWNALPSAVALSASAYGYASSPSPPGIGGGATARPAEDGASAPVSTTAAGTSPGADAYAGAMDE